MVREHYTVRIEIWLSELLANCPSKLEKVPIKQTTNSLQFHQRKKVKDDTPIMIPKVVPGTTVQETKYCSSIALLQGVTNGMMLLFLGI